MAASGVVLGDTSGVIVNDASGCVVGDGVTWWRRQCVWARVVGC